MSLLCPRHLASRRRATGRRPSRTTHKQDVIQVNNVYPGPAVLLTGDRWLQGWLQAAGYRPADKKKPAALCTTNAYSRAGADQATDAPLLLETRL
jgi:hypothetical protein